MNIASTELTDLCKKVFEGMGFPLGDYEDCAQVITWLEMHGLPILNQMQQFTPNWGLPKSQAATILFEDDSLAVIDAQKNGGLVYGSLAIDLAYLKALQTGFGMVKLQQARHRQLIIPSLVKCAQRGMSGAVFWRDADQEHVVTMQAQSKYPCYCIYQSTCLPDSQQDSQTLSILCTTNFALTQQVGTPLSQKTLAHCMMPDDFAAHYQHHNEVGLDIDEAIWIQLVALSKNVLVKSTKLSRLRGAGGAEN